MVHKFSKEDEGKSIVSTEDHPVGTITRIEDGKAYVEPDPELTSEQRASLGWDDLDDDETAYYLEVEKIEASTDDRIRVPHFF